MSRIQIRRGTAAQWTNANPTLYAGEFGYETDTNKVKLGNGTTAWNSLAYVSLEYDTFAGLTATLTNKTISGSTNTLTNIAQSSVTDLETDLGAKEDAANKGQANGYAALDGDGLVPLTQLPVTQADWTTLEGKPAYVAAGATKADARNAIDAEYTGNKGQANGYASLDENGYIPLSQWGAQVVDAGGADATATVVIDGGTA